MAMQRNYFSILFWIKKTKLLKNGEAPICMRITVNGKRAEIQIKRSVEINKWNAQRACWVDGMPFAESVRFAQGCSSMALSCEYTNNPDLSIANVISLVENAECLN